MTNENEEAIKNLKKLKSFHNGSYGTAIDHAIKLLEQQPKMQDCEHCIHTYGTLGCCDMVNNEWIYDCEFGKEQYKKEHESQPCEEENPNCTECRYYDKEKHYCPRFCQVIENTMAEITSEQTRWIPVSERLPLCEQEVLICTQRRSIGGKTKSIITSAVYEDGNMRERNSRWHWEDIEYESWDEEEDCGIIPEGWWEYRHYNPDEVYNNLVDDFILAWMPLPKPYAESEDEE